MPRCLQALLVLVLVLALAFAAGCDEGSVSSVPARMRQALRPAKLSDHAIVELHRRGLTEGEVAAVLQLRRSGLLEEPILELSRLGLIGSWAGEAAKLHRAGISEGTIVELARFRAAGDAILSAGALIELQRAGLREQALLELIRRHAPEADVPELVRLRRGGASEAAIFQRYPRR
jgi:hypothetical protein